MTNAAKIKETVAQWRAEAEQQFDADDALKQFKPFAGVAFGMLEAWLLSKLYERRRKMAHEVLIAAVGAGQVPLNVVARWSVETADDLLGRLDEAGRP